MTSTDATLLVSGEVEVWHVAQRDAVLPRVASYLNVAASRLQVDRSCAWCGHADHGKPRLGGEHAGLIDWSASTSRGLTLVAVTRAGTVGLDVERLRVVHKPLRIAERFFAPTEAEAVAAADDPANRFLRQWVRKEAFAKAVGVGIVKGMTWFAIDEDSDGGETLLVSVRGLRDDDWLVRDIDVGDRLVAALAFKRRSPGARPARS